MNLLGSSYDLAPYLRELMRKKAIQCSDTEYSAADSMLDYALELANDSYNQDSKAAVIDQERNELCIRIRNLASAYSKQHPNQSTNEQAITELLTAHSTFKTCLKKPERRGRAGKKIAARWYLFDLKALQELTSGVFELIIEEVSDMFEPHLKVAAN